VDILQEGWVEVPIGLGEVAVAKAEFAVPADTKVQPLLRVVDGRYVLLTKGVGRRTLKIDFVRQLVTQPGLKRAELPHSVGGHQHAGVADPEENMKVDVEPMLAAGTTAAEVDGKKATKFQAFLGTARQRQAQLETAHAGGGGTRTGGHRRAVPAHPRRRGAHQLRHSFDLDIRRRGLDAFTLQLPAD